MFGALRLGMVSAIRRPGPAEAVDSGIDVPADPVAVSLLREPENGLDMQAGLAKRHDLVGRLDRITRPELSALHLRTDPRAEAFLSAPWTAFVEHFGEMREVASLSDHQTIERQQRRVDKGVDEDTPQNERAVRGQGINELGIALFLPNVRDSTGFGKCFVNHDNGPFLRENPVKDIGALVCVLEMDATLDASRFAVPGGIRRLYVLCCGRS